MKWINRLLFLALFILQLSSFAQNTKEEVLLTIGDEKVTSQEFERIYLKNNQMVSEADKKSLSEYLNLFINYKLKVVEAISQGLDKKSSFTQELDGYRKQLVQPYLNDPEMEKKLIEEAYQRMRYEVSASHILISVPEKSTPEDTVALYNKVMNIRERILKGEPFEVVARATSDDPSVKRNNGFLGYFSVFQMVYPFENAAYRTPVGEISMPVRTRYGYHIVKVHDKRPARGQIKVAHIMVAIPQNTAPEKEAEAKKKFDMVYKQVLNNEDFANLARQFSDDPGSAKNGGELPWFGAGRMVPEFEQAAFALDKNGQVSEPLRTGFGWHVIKRIDKKDVGTYEEMLPEIKNKITRDNRMLLSRRSFIEQLKLKNGFSQDTNVIKTMVEMLDSSLYKGAWKIPEVAMEQQVFTFANQPYSLEMLAKRVENAQKNPTSLPFSLFVERVYNDFVDETILQFEENRLLKENDDFYFLMKEYHDGILLFEITDMNVWGKASSDTVGLQNFYESNILKYSWDKRAHAKMYLSNSEDIAKKAAKLVASKKGAKLTDTELSSKFITDSISQLTIEPYACGIDDAIIKGFENWDKGISPVAKHENGFRFVKFISVNENEPKPLNDIRGQVIADYQEFLEAEWLNKLKAKHPVVVNQDVFEKMKANLN
ncbi:MAG TPA: peptidylprolyl isomerase [Tenuifilaceae bacterium]|nr:peptidylprolyl isomerase [Tenuifilaceae bacterium]HPE17276.1 peptidylprolyl isomerase [Tenuifilaceae bacterium]HPQ33040.1 peptidylprolyl isomerase [Tenuifilaceae bacterium]HRX67732.1 peptidylprolyl isomerase [Tenuifilaceae bacterium]